MVGFSGSGKSTLAACIGQLYRYTGGHVLIGDKEVTDLTKADTVNTIGIVAQSPFIFDGTIEENLLYSYRGQARTRPIRKRPPNRLPSLDDMIGVLQQSGIFVDVLRFGLNAILDRERYPDLAPKLVRRPGKFSARLRRSAVRVCRVFRPGPLSILLQRG